MKRRIGIQGHRAVLYFEKRIWYGYGCRWPFLAVARVLALGGLKQRFRRFLTFEGEGYVAWCSRIRADLGLYFVFSTRTRSPTTHTPIRKSKETISVRQSVSRLLTAEFDLISYHHKLVFPCMRCRESGPCSKRKWLCWLRSALRTLA